MTDRDTIDSMLRGVAAAPPLHPPLRAGHRLGDRYVIEASLGEGGMGVVYRALDTKLGEPIALKIVKGAHGEAALRDEVRLAQKVAHPNVCRTFDLEDVDGRTFVKMELVAGETLGARLARDGRLPIAECLRISRAIVAGLEAIHACGIVHGDLKPGNVMLDGDRVVMMDFGVAHLATSPTDGVYGTIGYLAPEKLRREPSDVRSDFYALGCVLFEMVTGARVVDAGTTIAVAIEKLALPPPEVHSRRTDVPRWLARAISLLLARDQAARLVGVARVVDGKRRGRGLIASVLVSVAIVGLVAARHTMRTWRPDVRGLPGLAATYHENISIHAVSPDGMWIAIVSDRETSGLPKLYLTATATGVSTRFEIEGYTTVDSVAWTDDGAALLIAANSGGNHDVALRVALAGTPPHLAGTPEVLRTGVNDVQPCGPDILYSIWAPGQYQIVSQHRTEYMGHPMKTLDEPRCDPTGHRMLVTEEIPNEPGDILLIDRSTGEIREVTTDHSITGRAVFTPDGDAVIAGRTIDGKTNLFEIPLDGGPARQLTFDDGPNTQPDLTADGRTIVFERDKGEFFPKVADLHGTYEIRGLPQGSILFALPVGRDQFVAQYERVGSPSQVALVTIATSKLEALAAGKFPFPASDHAKAYFADPIDGRFLDEVSFTSHVSRRIATLPGSVIGGCDGPDGIHVLIALGTDKFGYRIATIAGHQEISYEHTHGLVCVSESGWKAVTNFRDEQHDWPLLQIVRPGASLQSGELVHASSMFNRWLDDHTLGYCTRPCASEDDACNPTCVEDDVRTGVRTSIATNVAFGGLLASELADHRVLDIGQRGQTDVRVLANFGER